MHIGRLNVSAKRPPCAAEKWLTGLFRAIFSLDELPARCPVSSEAKELGFPARHLLYGKGRGVYRIIFHIREDEQPCAGCVWHSSRDAITADVEESRMALGCIRSNRLSKT